MMLDKLKILEDRYMEIENLISQPEVVVDHTRVQQLAKEHSSLQDTVRLYREYQQLLASQREAKLIVDEASDSELLELAKDEIQELNSKISDVEDTLKRTLIAKDPNDEKDVILEIRAGTGGSEAAIFAADLARAYTRYSESRGWKVDIMNSSASELNGYKEVILGIKGEGVFGTFKYERGVHRVQRVPMTETAGRIHTSTATVAVMPEVDEVEMNIRPDELRIDVFHAGGHGGQNVNKVATAVRVVHIPTGTTAVCQDERSQFRNRNKALSILRARLLEREIQKQESELSELRRSQVGSGRRSEKIRTYNFPQDRVTDHRIGMSFHGLDAMLNGELRALVEALVEADQVQKLKEVLS